MEAGANAETIAETVKKIMKAQIAGAGDEIST
jgi:hypothetical protein